MENAHSWAVDSLPPVIDPTIAALEIRSGASAKTATWEVWPHLDIAEIGKQISPPDNVVHWFGPCPGLDQCVFAVGYNPSGQLTHLAIRGQTGWQCDEVPAEVTGRVETRPSIRMVFKTQRACDLFRLYLQQVARDQVHNPTLQMLLGAMSLSCGQTAVLRELSDG